MLIDILKRDLRRSRTMNVIILLFVILAVTFIASSVGNLTAVTSSLDDYFDQAGVGDYVVVERGSIGRSAAEIAEEEVGAESVSNELILYLTEPIRHEEEAVKDIDSFGIVNK